MIHFSIITFYSRLRRNCLRIVFHAISVSFTPPFAVSRYGRVLICLHQSKYLSPSHSMFSYPPICLVDIVCRLACLSVCLVCCLSPNCPPVSILVAVPVRPFICVCVCVCVCLCVCMYAHVEQIVPYSITSHA